MAIATGINTVISILEETTYGTNIDNAAYDILPFKTSSLAVTKTSHENANITGDRSIQDAFVGVESVGGEITMDLSDQPAVELLFLGLLGDDAASSGEMVVGNVRQSYTIEQDYSADINGTGDVHIFKGMEVNSFSMSIPADGVVEATFGFVGNTVEVANASDASSPTDYTAANEAFHSSSVTITEGAANNICTDLTLNIENGITTGNVIGSRTPVRGGFGLCRVSGSLTAHFDSETLLNKFLDNTVSALTIQLGSSGSGLKFTIPKIKYTAGAVTVQEGLLSVAMDFVAYADGTTSIITIDNVL